MNLNLNAPFESLRGSIAVVTGAGGGIGRAVTAVLIEVGMTVVAVDRSEHALSELPPQGMVPVIADVSDAAGMAVIERAVEESGSPLALWMNNAGIVSRDPIATMTAQEWDELMAVNVRSVFLGAQTAHRLMTPAGRGAIVNVASMSSTRVQRHRTAYAASKAAVINTTRNLGVEWGDTGIRVNAIAPGFVLTPMSNWHILDEAGRAQLTDGIPLGRLADPKEIAHMALLLASDLTSYVNGECIHVDGGWSL